MTWSINSNKKVSRTDFHDQLCSGAPCPTDCPLRSVDGRFDSALWCHVTEEVKERPLTYKSSPRQDVSLQTRLQRTTEHNYFGLLVGQSCVL